MPVDCCRFFKCQPRIIILFDIDRPAVDKSKFLQQMLHRLIVPMGINAQVTALVERPVYAECSDALTASIPKGLLSMIIFVSSCILTSLPFSLYIIYA